MLGRVVKTIYILKYFNEEDLRNRVSSAIRLIGKLATPARLQANVAKAREHGLIGPITKGARP